AVPLHRGARVGRKNLEVILREHVRVLREKIAPAGVEVTHEEDVDIPRGGVGPPPAIEPRVVPEGKVMRLDADPAKGVSAVAIDVEDEAGLGAVRGRTIEPEGAWLLSVDDSAALEDGVLVAGEEVGIEKAVLVRGDDDIDGSPRGSRQAVDDHGGAAPTPLHCRHEVAGQLLHEDIAA